MNTLVRDDPTVGVATIHDFPAVVAMQEASETAYDAFRNGTEMPTDVPMTTQERA